MSLLFDKNDILLVNRPLAGLIGLNEAIILQQIHYWIKSKRSGVEHRGQRWIFNSLDRWQEQFPFWSQDTVKRALNALKLRGLVQVKKLSENGLNRTNYYTIDYQQVALLEASNLHSSISANCTNGAVQSAPIEQGKKHSRSGQIAPTIGANCPDDYIDTKTTTETTVPAAPQPAPKVDAELVDEKRTALQTACRATWAAYRDAYIKRYGVPPVRNEPTSSKVKQFVQRVGQEEAAAIAQFFVERVNERFVVQAMHDVGLLLQRAEGYRTQWATGATMTGTKANQIDQSQANYDTAAEAAAMLRARRAAKDQQGGAAC